MSMYDEAPEMKTLATGLVVAKKDHVCICGLPIHSGDKYLVTVTVMDGRAETSRMGYHAHSWEIEETDGNAGRSFDAELVDGEDGDGF